MRHGLVFTIAVLTALAGSAIGSDDYDTLVYNNHTVKVGQYFDIAVKSEDFDRSLLPSWLYHNGSRIIGVPRIDRIMLDANSDRVDLVHLGENVYSYITTAIEESSHCKYDPMLLFEIYINKNFNQLSSQDLSNVIDDFAFTMDVPKSSIRVFPAKYLDTWRVVQHETFPLEDATVDPDQLVVTWIAGCGDPGEDIFNTASVITDNNYNFRATQSFLRTLSWKDEEYLKQVHALLPVQPFTVTPIGRPEVMRTTREVDHPPVKINSLPSFKCTLGRACDLTIPENTFADEEQTERDLAYKVTLLDDSDKSYLSVDDDRHMKGVFLKPGTYEYRLEARDRRNQFATAPFRVIVQDVQPSNFGYETLIDLDLANFDGVKVWNFVNKLGKVLVLNANEIRLHFIEEGRGIRQTSLRWSYDEFEKDNKCKINEITAYLNKMTRKRDVKVSFARNMGADFHVREVKLYLSGVCLNKTTAEADIASSSAAAGSGEQEVDGSKSSTLDESSPAHTPVDQSMGYTTVLPRILVIVAVCVLLILALLIVAYCCVFRKTDRKKHKPLDYVTKGHPVVFPNELAQEDDITSATVPMLIKDEHPPLQPQLDGTTIHENPLYKAPSTAPSTFSAPDKGQVNTIGAARLAPNQRLPPPYVAP